MKSKHKALSILLLMVMMVLFTGTLSYAGNIPQMINYSGTLTNSSGTPVANGNYNIEFKIYDVASGGASLWSEKWDTTTSQVTVVGGIFNVMLGFKVPIPASFFADHPLTYLGIKVGTDSEMLPRQQITSVGYAFTAGNGIPKGGIIMWSGAVNQMPDGWALCDGNNGTPNLMNNFVVGAGSTYGVGNTGGSATKDLSHAHSYSGTVNQSSNTKSKKEGSNGSFPLNGSDHQHGYSGNTDLGGSAAQDILPPYYALAFIMKL